MANNDENDALHLVEGYPVAAFDGLGLIAIVMVAPTQSLDFQTRSLYIAN